jgi:hydrogenase/urease accessory protein HupE
MKRVISVLGLQGLLLLVAFILPPAADAHRLRPAIATVTFDGDAGFTVSIQVNLEAVLAGIGPEHEDTNESPKAPIYDALRELSPEDLRSRFADFEAEFLAGLNLAFDGRAEAKRLAGISIPPLGDTAVERLSVIQLSGSVPPGAEMFTWRLAPEFGESALRIGTAADGIVRSEWLVAGAQSDPFPLDPALAQARTTWQVVQDYTVLGFTHILPKGLDHILFVLGIFLLSLKWRPLLYQVTAFTIAHTITLALSLYGIVSLPASIVEPLIALSIVYVAIENIITPSLKPWRVYVVFTFGLLHGLGFAGVLTELGLPRDEFVTALIAFNVGVELGQLAVIVLAFLAVGLWFRQRDWYRRGIVVPASLMIALVGAYWTVERVIGLG